MKKIQANLTQEEITSNTVEAQNLFAKSKFGEKFQDKILYSPYETLFLIQENTLEITDHKNKPITEKEIIAKFSRKNKNFLSNYRIFQDLRKKGYIVKTALKFGAEFRVYEKNQTKHSKWICFPSSENSKLTWRDFTAKNRVAHSSKKNLLIAIIDDENDISYYEVKWTKP